eukprot:CAMPEP_0170493566 /NCGR_PEP_ID=MMETSP0208-20121228/14115_1 /TAXON_ID=197538 /ORGANISM="Strombidium inclinatum, Strain S3" /LENGTH=67 /DNA_ID=CAMNT_0010769513 /DNA_START=17 /DNA_END=220 /DNA_ORIENTATION=+
MPNQKDITLQEAKLHNKKGDYWIRMGDTIYDLSEFDHPGGFLVLHEYAGCKKDGWQAFEDQGHTKKA